MEQEIYSWIKNIIIYMIINTIIMNLLGNKSYKKYVSVVSGMILVLIVISPVMKLMKINENLDYYLQSNEFAIETSDFKNRLYQMEEEQSEAVFNDYERKVKLQVEELLHSYNIYLDSFDVTIDRDSKSQTFGEIQYMGISGTMKDNLEEKKKSSLQIDQVDRIDIAQIEIVDREKEMNENLPSPMEIDLKKRLSDFYNMEQGNINITIQGG